MQYESLESRQMMAADVFYYSLATQRNLENSDGSVLVADSSDIVKLTIEDDGSYLHETFFDGSDVQLSRSTEGINAFAFLPNNDLLIATDGRFSVNGVSGDDEDILRFRPSSTGETTRGSWGMYLDGSDVGLGANVDGIRVGIDGLAVLSNGQLVVSLDNNADFPLDGLNVADEDLLLFDAERLGTTTRGTWSRYFDGSDVGLSDGFDPKREDINAVHVDDNGSATPLIYVSAVTKIDAPSVSAQAEDVAIFRPSRLGETTRGRFRGMVLDGSRYGLGNASVNAFALAPPSVAALPEVNINDIRKEEGNRGTTRFVFTVSLSSAPTQQVTVDYSTANGSAKVADRDFISRTGKLRWVVGDSSPKTIVVSVPGDTKAESDERFFLDLRNAQNAVVADNRGVGTILDDDTITTATPSLRINNVRQLEGDRGLSQFVFTVSLSSAATKPVSVSYATTDATAKVSDQDYLSKRGRLSWPAGDASPRRISVTVRGDTKVEPNERFLVNLMNASNATLADSQGVGTILNSDKEEATISSIRINDVRRVEGDRGLSQLVFTVSLSEAPTSPVRVKYSTADGTAKVSDRDYVARSGALRWTAGDTSTKTISVPVRGDPKIESNEQFFVNLSNPQNATIADWIGRGTIVNDDAPATSAETLYYSLSRERNLTSSDGSTLRVKPEDILKLTRFTDGSFKHEIHFDGSDVGLDGKDIKAYTVLGNGDILVAIEGEPILNGSRVFDEDIMRFRPRSLGENQTRGTWSSYFDGSRFGIGPNTSGIRASISALDVLPNGDLVMSLGRPLNLPGVGPVEQRDLVRFTPNPKPTGRGPISDGTWSLYFDGSDQQLETSSEAINALTLRPRSGNSLPELVFSTAGRSVINDTANASEDLVSFLPSRLGSITRGRYPTQRVLDGTDVGLNFGDLDAVFDEIGRA